VIILPKQGSYAEGKREQGTGKREEGKDFHPMYNAQYFDKAQYKCPMPNTLKMPSSHKGVA
jgi:hypothetical protein